MPSHLNLTDQLLDFWTSLKRAAKSMSRFVLSDPQLPPRESLAPKLGDGVDSQTQSPLFSAIPPEIRNRIFSIALTAYDDKTKPYQPQNWFYRPEWHFHPKISTTLLRTCKRIYLECYLLPLALNSHTFWAGADRAPPPQYFASAHKKQLPSGRGRQLGNWTASEDFRTFFNKLTAEQRGAVGELHFFFQQYYLECLKFSPPLDPDSSRPVAAKKLKITMRHQDWYWWERNEKLGLCPWNRGRTLWNQMDSPMPKTRMDWLSSQGWGAQLQYIEGLEEFELELETLVEKKWQMDGIVERAKRWIFPLKQDSFLRWDSVTGIKESRWEEDDVVLNGDVPSPDGTVIPVAPSTEEIVASVIPVPSTHGPAPLSAANLAMLQGPTHFQQEARNDTMSQCSIVARANGQTQELLVAKRQYYVVSLAWKMRTSGDDETQSSPGKAME